MEEKMMNALLVALVCASAALSGYILWDGYKGLNAIEKVPSTLSVSECTMDMDEEAWTACANAHDCRTDYECEVLGHQEN